jgi:polyhydroxybutyrate depolymerase
MKERSGAGPIVALGVVLGSGGCGRADLYAITSDAADSGSGGRSVVEPAMGGGAGRAESASCPSPVLPPGDRSLTLQVGSVSRSYVLHVPSTYDGSRAVPLVLDFHGIGSTGWGELASSPYPAVTDPEGVIMAFPDGLVGPIGTGWNMGPCCVADVDDLAFARSLVTEIRGQACVDPTRVYAVGVLTGGGMVYHLACQAADVFAAVAPAAFDLLAETADDCRPSRPITVMSFRGTADTHVGYEGGASSLVPGMPITFLGAEATFARWAEIDGCTGAATAPDANGCSSYSGCPGGVEVILCTKEGGREEPGDATLAWPVLARHAL